MEFLAGPVAAAVGGTVQNDRLREGVAEQFGTVENGAANAEVGGALVGLPTPSPPQIKPGWMFRVSSMIRRMFQVVSRNPPPQHWSWSQ